MNFPTIPNATLLKLLEPPTGKARIVIDTDTYNEIDDQFAVVWALLSPESVDVEAMYAAPFFNHRSTSPGEGMEKSYDEILQLLVRMEGAPQPPVFKGAQDILHDFEQPQTSAAVDDLIERAMASSVDDPLYVVAIGAITNIASAILIEPRIIEKIVVVWLGGNALHWPHSREFNLQGDVKAAQLVFDCGVPLVQLPCAGVVSELHTTVPELALHVKGKGAIGDFLFERYAEYNDDHFGWSKEVWDLAALAWMITPDAVEATLIPSPIITDHCTYSFDPRRHLISSSYQVHRDPIFADLFRKLADFAG